MKRQRQFFVYLKKNPKVKTGITISADEEEVSDSSYSLYKGFEQDGWYCMEDRRLGKIHAADKGLFFYLLSEGSDHEF